MKAMKSTAPLLLLATPAAPHTTRRTTLAPLNTFVRIKDEFDARRNSIEGLVFQTLNAFSMNHGAFLFVYSGMVFVICNAAVVALSVWW